jgi:hypothetical protein
MLSDSYSHMLENVDVDCQLHHVAPEINKHDKEEHDEPQPKPNQQTA